MSTVIVLNKEEQEILNDNFEEALEPTELLEESSNDFELSMDNEENLLEQFDTEPLDLTQSSIEKNNESNEDILEIIEDIYKGGNEHVEG